MKAYNTSHLELRNVQVNPESGPAFLVRDSKDLLLEDVSSMRPGETAPIVRLDRCPDAIATRQPREL